MEEASHMDGNASAGPLMEVFAFDATTAVGRCGDCGHTDVLARAKLYSGGPGLVLRCAGCDGVLLRHTTNGSRTWFDMTGLASLQIEHGQ